MDHGTQSHSLLKKIADSWAHWVHLVYSAIVVVSALVAGWLDAKDVKIHIAYIGLTGYVLVLMFFFGYFALSYSRKARYAEAVASIDVAMRQIGSLSIHLDQCLKQGVAYETADAVDRLRSILGSVVNAFNVATAVSNRCCIKMLGRNSADREYVKTLCRDPVSHELNRAKDQNEGDSHFVDDNSDFLLILRSGLEYYFSADVAKEGAYYRNTSINNSTTVKQLPYASVLVLPISRRTMPGNSFRNADQQNSVYGFLALDARARRAYEPRFDVHMASVIASALYPIFMQMETLEVQQRRSAAIPTPV